ncbi:MAG: energy-coupled thiamine transporter ThiT [Erysipelotrichaceae bacterium]|nr:energy-coupled thiamine transporter ThiT [Erysipelotrichaceae bacterium]
MKNSKTRDLVYMALYAAMFVVLDLVTIWRMPQGGSINLSSIALLLASYHLGWKKGAICGLVANGLLYVTGSMNFYGSVISLFFDYLFAYTAYGFASLFPNAKYFYSGIVITSLIRLACSTFSGCVAWETPLWASLGYNAEYIIPVMVIDMVVVPLIFEKLKPIINK